MKAVLRYLHSPDLPDLENGTPPDPESFAILVQAMIGADDEPESEESFDFVLCTPGWLAIRLGAGSHIWGRHHLLVPRYDFATLHGAVQAVCEGATGPDWETIAGILGRYGKWEFEDYSAQE